MASERESEREAPTIVEVAVELHPVGRQLKDRRVRSAERKVGKGHLEEVVGLVAVGAALPGVGELQRRAVRGVDREGGARNDAEPRDAARGRRDVALYNEW